MTDYELILEVTETINRTMDDLIQSSHYYLKTEDEEVLLESWIDTKNRLQESVKRLREKANRFFANKLNLLKSIFDTNKNFIATTHVNAEQIKGKSISGYIFDITDAIPNTKYAEYLVAKYTTDLDALFQMLESDADEKQIRKFIHDNEMDRESVFKKLVGSDKPSVNIDKLNDTARFVYLKDTDKSTIDITMDCISKIKSEYNGYSKALAQVNKEKKQLKNLIK